MGDKHMNPGRLFVWFILLAAPFYCAPASFAAGAAEKSATKESTPPKDPFNLILPYTDVTVGQGQEVSMDADVVNRTKDPVQVDLTIQGVPSGWEVNFNSRYPAYPVRSVMVQGEKSNTLEFKAKVPEKAKPGNYELTVSAKEENGRSSQVEKVMFHVTSKKIETGGLKLTSQYPVLTTPTGQTLKFTVDLKNETNKPLVASLVAEAPKGWSVRFKPQFGDTQISSIALKENATETLSVEIDSPAEAGVGQSPVTIRARAGAFEATTNLKVSLKGTTDLKIGTASGTLNTAITAGKKTPVQFLVGNAGTAPIHNLSFIAKKPDKWTIDFKPEKIDALNPGDVRQVNMEILAPARAIAGDYLISLASDSPDAKKSVDFRVTVSTPTLWGWIGAAIVAAVVLGLAIVFIRLGRR